jgi:hypothetical protein
MQPSPLPVFLIGNPRGLTFDITTRGKAALAGWAGPDTESSYTRCATGTSWTRRHPPPVVPDVATKHTRIKVRAGAMNCIEANVDLAIAESLDGETEPFSRYSAEATVVWAVKRRVMVNGKYERVEDYSTPIEFRADELEAFAVAFYRAFQLAKHRGHLPPGGTDGGREVAEK